MLGKQLVVVAAAAVEMDNQLDLDAAGNCFPLQPASVVVVAAAVAENSSDSECADFGRNSE